METRSIKRLEELHVFAGEVLSACIKDSIHIIALSGDLGAGKTALTKELAKLLNIQHEITSPTFVVMKSYEIPKSITLPEPTILNAVQDASEACDQSVENYSAGVNERSNTEMHQNSWLWLTHIDAYRIESDDEMRVIRIHEILQDDTQLVCIEWPEKIESIFPTRWYAIQIILNGDGTRTLTYGIKT